MKKIIILTVVLFSCISGFSQREIRGKLQIDSIYASLSSSDTTTIKPVGVGADNKLRKLAAWSIPSVTEGTYTATLTNTTNVAASTPVVVNYQRIGDVVKVWGTVSIDATAALAITELGVSLPINSSVSAIQDLAGTGACDDNTVIKIIGDTSNSRAKFRLYPQTATNNEYSFSFTYKYVAP